MREVVPACLTIWPCVKPGIGTGYVKGAPLDGFSCKGYLSGMGIEEGLAVGNSYYLYAWTTTESPVYENGGKASILRQGFSVQLWLSWNLLCRLSWPWTHRDPLCLGLKACTTTIWLRVNLRNRKHTVCLELVCPKLRDILRKHSWIFKAESSEAPHFGDHCGTEWQRTTL